MPLIVAILFSLSLYASENPITPCPDKPNCLSSLEKGDQYFAPLVYNNKNLAELKTIIENVLKNDGAEIATKSNNALHAIYTSRVFRFKDDVWFYIDESNQTLHLKSASRTGHYDFNVNQKRLNRLKELLEPLLTSETAQ